MVALQILSLKDFMFKLLKSEVFDIFLLEEAVISTANTFTIDGHINRDFYNDASAATSDLSEDVPPAYTLRPWKDLKGLCFDLIKGKRTPLSFRFILHLSPEETARYLSSQDIADAQAVKSFVVNVKYDGSKAVLTSGTSYNTFVLSKEADVLWDNILKKYLLDNAIEFEEL